jgi:hypothetical protein
MKTAIIAVLVAALTITANAQSLLTTPAETSEHAAAREVLAAPAQTRDAIIGQLNDAFSRLWDHPNPQGVLDAMGPKAAAVFAINTKFAVVLSTLLTEEGDAAALARFQALMAKVPPVTINQDGTVTILPPPVPTPSPEP